MEMSLKTQTAAAKTPDHVAPSVWPVWIAGAAVVLFGLFLRLTALTRAPLYIDSIFHINRAHLVLEGNFFVGMNNQKWLYTVVLAALNPTGPEAVWVARAISALSATVTIAAGIAIGSWLGFVVGGRRVAWKIGLLSGLVYAVLPMAVFHERQGLVDPMMTAFASLVVVITIWQSRRPRPWLIVPLAIALAGVPLTKFLGLPFLGIPIAGAVLLPRDGQTRRRALIYSIVSIVAASVVVGVIYWLGSQSGTNPQTTHRASTDSILLFSIRSPATQQLLADNFRYAVEALTSYVGVAILVLAALVQVWIIAGVAWREALYVSVPGIAFMAIPVLVRQVTGRGYMPPRYLLPNAMPLVVLAIFSLVVLLDRLRGLRSATSRLILALVVVEILIPAARFDAITIRTPVETPFTSVDELQYLENYDWAGTRQLADYLLGVWEDGGREPLTILGHGNDLGAVKAYMGPRTGDFMLLVDTDDDWYAFISDGLAGGRPVYLFYREDAAWRWRNPDGAQMEPIGVYSLQHLFQITGAKGRLAGEVFEREAGDPASMDEDYDALAGALAADPTERIVLVFPPSHAPDLAARIDLPVLPLEVDHWPLTPEGVEAAISALDLGTDQPVDLVIANEAAVDAEGVVAAAFQRRFDFTGEEEWYGVFHQRRFVTGPNR
jgi:hypothetical protein